jgi:hypothetical protein
VKSEASTPLGASLHLASAAELQPKQQALFHHRGTEFAEFEVFDQNSLLGALRVSAVNSLLDRYNQLCIAAWIARAT